MKFADFLLKTKEFLIHRIAELFGLIIIFFSIALFLSIATYSPEDPNFIFNQQAIFLYTLYNLWMFIIFLL